MYSLKGRLALKRALVGVISHSLRDLVPKPTDIPTSIKLIQLFHGQCVKAVRFGMNEGFEDNNEATDRRLEASLITYAISTSDFMSNLWEKCMDFGRDKHITSGYPRNDCLIKVPDKNKLKWNNFMNGEIFQNTILYAPTYRPGKKPTTFFPFPDYSKDLLFDILDRTKSILLLRPHLTDLVKYKELKSFLNDLASYKRIKLATHAEFTDINTFLPFVDVLVTDYSSLYHDFLLLNKPMIFIPYDYDHYNKRSGFLYDYFENLPGPSVNTFGDFSKELFSVSLASDNYGEKRASLAAQIHEYSDANACERVSNLVEDLLK
jgi:CDP-glycerol glycerophosphotransferase (TagB/SpsB family)|tara:strand:- start:416 stop:1375 length:960 start_codon:yes stop_codon:yes gene_type:complete